MSGDHNQYQKDKSYLDGMDRYKQVRELVKDPSLRVTEIAWKTGYNKGHVSRLRKEAMRQALDTDLARVGEVGVWGECEPQEALEDGWCDWVCPRPRGYLMQCCDCELVHEVDFRVVRYESEYSEVYAVVDDPNLQAQMRLRRRDDLSPKREWVGLTDEERHSIREWQEIQKELGPVWAPMMLYLYLAIEAKLKEKNHG